MIRALVETNVLLDYLLVRPTFAATAVQLWDACAQGRFEGYIAAISPINVYYIGRKAMGDTIKARQAVTLLLSQWRVCPVTEAELQAAVGLPIADYEDAVQVASALALGIETLVTRDATDFSNAGLMVLSPEAFLARLNTQS